MVVHIGLFQSDIFHSMYGSVFDCWEITCLMLIGRVHDFLKQGPQILPQIIFCFTLTVT